MAICAYGQSAYLEEAILSLKNQTASVKLLLATSTPSDFIENLARKYDLEYHINPVRGGGIAADWEFAVSCAQTEYVTIAHQDDIYFPEYAEMTHQAFQKNPNSLIVFTDYCDLVKGEYLFNRSYLWIKRLLLWPYSLKSSWKSKLMKRSALSFGNAICCPSVTYNIRKLGVLQFDRSYSVNLDWAKWLELSSLNGNFTYINKRLMAHRIDESTETSAAVQDNRRYNEDLRILSSIWGKTIAKFLMIFYSKSYKMATAEGKHEL